MVHLADGTGLDADLVVVGIGVVPAVEWLEGSGLTLDNGVVCDRDAVRRRPTWWRPGTWPGGPIPGSGEQVRVEHWTNAAERGCRRRPQPAGRVGRPPSPTTPSRSSGPTSTTTKIQMIGLPGPDDEVVVVEGSVEEGKLVALYRRGDRLRAALAFSRPRHLMAYRPLLAAGASFDEALGRCRGREARPAGPPAPATPDRNRRVKARAAAICSAEGSMPP